MTPLPLSGINVVDLTRVLAGPLCSMMLGDLGANVIKMERPGRGDDTRGWGPPFDDRGESAYYLSTNRNKLSVAVDLAIDSERAFVRGLMGDADIVIENFLPGALGQWGIDPLAELQRNPSLVWASITGFGEENRRLGYDYVVQAESGWMAITGEPDGAPMKSGIALADIIAGKDAAIAILAALSGRQKLPAADRRIAISLADSARAALMNVAQNALVAGGDARRWGNAHANLVPYQLFHAEDRPIVIAVGTDEQWVALSHALGRADLAADASLRTNAGRLAQRSRVSNEVALALSKRPAAAWRLVLDAAKVPCGLVHGVLEAIQQANTASPLTGMPSSVGGKVRFPPPRLDEHGAAIRAHGWGVFEGYP